MSKSSQGRAKPGKFSRSPSHKEPAPAHDQGKSGKIIKANQRGKTSSSRQEPRQPMQEQLFPGEHPPQGGNGAGEETLISAENTAENTAETSSETSGQNATASHDGDEKDGATIITGTPGANGGADEAAGSQPGAGADAAEETGESGESVPSEVEPTVPTEPPVHLLVNGPDGCFKEVEGGETVKLSEEEWRLELARIFRREAPPS